jgi:hypothetical protein
VGDPLPSKQVDLERFKADAEGYLKDATDFAVKGLVAR